MIKKLRKVGNSTALILDKPILELIGLDENAQVQLTVRDGCLIVAPADPRVPDHATFETALENAIGKRRRVLKKLAE